MHGTNFIETKRLSLIPLAASDRAFVAGLLRCADVRRYLGGAVDEAAIPAVFASYLASMAKARVWTVRKRTNRNPVGMIFLSDHHDQPNLELSFQFLKNVWHYGYATEACAAVLHVAENEGTILPIIAETQSANTAAIALLEKLDMTRKDTFARFGTEQVLYTR